MNKKGFTLIELLGVILIISLLVMIVLPRITNSVKNFSSKTDKLMLNMIKDAAKLYVGDNVSKFKKENGSNYCVTIQDLVNENYLKGPIEYKGENITNTKGLKVSYNNGFEYEFINLYKGSCTLVDYVGKLFKETKTTTVNGIEYSLDETHLLMNDRLGSNDVCKTDGNIRYYGLNPNNYIDIGDRDSEGNIIFWRIIGVFKDIEVTDENGNVISTEDLVKIIRADKLTAGDINSFSWDYKYDGTTISNSNVWSTATLNALLNITYYNSGTTSYYNNSTTPTTLNFASTGLSSEAHNKIERVKWSLGEHNWAGFYSDKMYEYERIGINKWSGKIALMYPSDYGYSSDLKVCQHTLYEYSNPTCKDTNWIYDSTISQFMLMPSSYSSSHVFIKNTDSVVGVGITTYSFGVRPVLYLKSDVSIVEEKLTLEGIKYFVVE